MAGSKILDFGVARLANSSMTASGFIVGTPDFMSPEQARGNGIDQRSDVFSAGAVFYYMLSGREAVHRARPARGDRISVNSEDPAATARPDESPPGSARVIDEGAGQVRRPTATPTWAQLLADLVRFEQRLRSASRARWRSSRRQEARRAGVGASRWRLRSWPTVSASSPIASESPFSDAAARSVSRSSTNAVGDALGVVPFRRAALMEIQRRIWQTPRRSRARREISQRCSSMGAAT